MSEEQAAGGGRLLIAGIVLALVVVSLAYLVFLAPGAGSPPPPTQFSTSQARPTTAVQSSGASSSATGTATTGNILRVTVKAVSRGGTEGIVYTGLTPVTISFTAESDGVQPVNYQWSFGDGTNATGVQAQHTFPVNKAYNIQLKATDATGALTSKTIVLSAFSSESTAKSIVVYPNPATVGVSDVGLEGGYATAGTRLYVSVDGAPVGTTVVNPNGFWSMDLGRVLTPKPNGSSYAISVSPLNKSRTLLTVEGITASPGAGVPGDQVVVTGASYPPSTSVAVYLGGVSLGHAQTDGYGSFQANFTVPSASPLNQVGQYQFSTSPPADGAQATFVIVRATSILSVPGIPLPGLGSSSSPFVSIAVVVAVIVVIALAVVLIRRRRNRYYLPPAEPAPGPAAAPDEEGPPEPSPVPPGAPESPMEEEPQEPGPPPEEGSEQA